MTSTTSLRRTGVSNTISYTTGGTNPAADIQSMSATVLGTGTAQYPLTLTGSGFVPKTTVRATSVGQGALSLGSCGSVGSTCTVYLRATMVDAADFWLVQATNPAPGGGSAGTGTLQVVKGNPPPQFAAGGVSLVIGGGDQSATLYGSGFTASTTVLETVTPTPLTVTPWTSTSITFTVPSSLTSTAATHQVTATNPAPGGGTSPAASVTITVGPVLTSLSPSLVAAGSSVPLTIQGTSLDLVTSYTAVVVGSGTTSAWLSPSTTSTNAWTVTIPSTYVVTGQLPVHVVIEGYPASYTLYLTVQ